MADGQYQVTGGSLLWSSSDYGVTWGSDKSGSWRAQALSLTGQYQTICDAGSVGIYDGEIWTSPDYGANWNLNATSKRWLDVAVSATGQYQTAVDYGLPLTEGKIYVSSDFGVTFVEKGSLGRWSEITMDSSGQNQIATNIAGDTYDSSDYGQTWAQRITGLVLAFLRVSSTGQYQTATVVNPGGSIQVSSDYGATWTTKLAGISAYGISMSLTGQWQTLTGDDGWIYVSDDYGATWAQKLLVVRSGLGGQWLKCATSGDGKYMSALDDWNYSTPNNGSIYVSSDYGENWGFDPTYSGVSRTGIAMSRLIHNLAVTYNGNGSTGGTEPVDTILYEWLDTANVLGLGDLVKTGEGLTHWNTQADDGGTDYDPSDTLIMTPIGITLYAIWAPDTNTITYDGNGENNGSTVDPKVYNVGDTVTVISNGFVKDFYDFDGWNTAADGSGTSYDPTDTFAFSAPDILYAQWAYIGYTRGTGACGIDDVPHVFKEYGNNFPYGMSPLYKDDGQECTYIPRHELAMMKEWPVEIDKDVDIWS